MYPLMTGPADQVHRAARHLRRVLSGDAGFSLIELTVVMVVMLAFSLR